MNEKFDYLKSAEFIAAKTKHTRVVRFFPDADLRCGHDGLRKMAQEHDIEVWDLKPGEFVVFSNTLKNKLKIYAPGNVIAYLKSPDNRRLDLNVIRLIPRFFNGTEFDYTAALKDVLKAKAAA